MTDNQILTALVCDWNGNKIAGIPPLNVKSGRFVMRSLDQFPDSEAVFGADERFNIYALQPFQTLKFMQQGIGQISWNVIHDPSLQIQDIGDEITLTLPHITNQLTHFSVGASASFQTMMGSIISQLGAVGETVEWLTLHNPDGSINEYIASGSDLIRTYDIKGNLIATQPGTGKFSGWSAVMLDDSPPTLSSQPANWGAFNGNVTVDGGNATKLTGTPFTFDGTIIGASQITSIAPGVNSPGGLQWTMGNVTSEGLVGLASPGGTTIFDVQYGIEFFLSEAPLQVPTPTAPFQIFERGNIPVGAVGRYKSGDVFSINVQYAGSNPYVVYMLNSQPIYFSAVTPALPFTPLGFLANPGGGIENAILSSTVNPSQQYYSITFPQQTPVGAILQTGTATGFHVRQADGGNGVPIRQLEVGKFGVQSNVRLTGGWRGDIRRMLANPKMRLVDALTWKRESSKVINTITPLGAGASSGSSQVDIGLCWQMVNDPSFQDYQGKYGSLAAVFPEYDQINYPIKRTLGRNGSWEYYVVDVASYRTLGMEIRGQYTDPQFTYPDTTVASQELVARALYVATIAKLKLESQINDTMTVETIAAFRPPQAGSKVLMDFKRIGGDTKGNFAVMNAQAKANLATPFVIQVDRVFATDQSIKDNWTLSFLPRLVDSSTASGQSAMTQLEAIKIISQNSTTYLHVYGDQDVDANPVQDHSLIIEVPIPDDVFRVTSAPLHVEFIPLRQQVRTSENSAANINITIPMTSVTITSIHENAQGTSHAISTLSGGSYDAAKGFATATNTVGAPLHYHQFRINSIAHSLQLPAPSTFPNGEAIYPDNWVTAFGGGNGVVALYANSGVSGSIPTGTNQDLLGVDLTPTTHGHTTPISQHLSVAATLSGTIDQQHITAPLPLHTHDIPTNLNDVTAPQSVDLLIDNGSGTFVYSSTLVTDKNSGRIGPWDASFDLADISQFVNFPGKKIRLKFQALDVSANGNFGVGHLRVNGYWRVEVGGLSSQVFSHT